MLVVDSQVQITEEISWLTNDDKKWIMERGVCERLGRPVA